VGDNIAGVSAANPATGKSKIIACHAMRLTFIHSSVFAFGGARILATPSV
jgi:hypothetical protein